MHIFEDAKRKVRFNMTTKVKDHYMFNYNFDNFSWGKISEWLTDIPFCFLLISFHCRVINGYFRSDSFVISIELTAWGDDVYVGDGNKND